MIRSIYRLPQEPPLLDSRRISRGATSGPESAFEGSIRQICHHLPASRVFRGSSCQRPEVSGLLPVTGDSRRSRHRLNLSQMKDESFPGLTRLQRLFARMIYLGIALELVGVVLGVIVGGGAGALIVGGSVGGGLAFIFGGYRGSRRGKLALARLRKTQDAGSS